MDERPKADSEGYWRILEPFWDKINIYDGPAVFLATYAAAPLVPRVLFAACFCESEVSNGGLHQFFTNSTGILAPEAVEAFRRVGFGAAAAILEEAMAFFDTPYPRDQEVRVARLRAVPGERREEWDPFFRLDERFYEALGPAHAPFYDALDVFAKAGQGEAAS
jgi:hypothetical protein